MAVYQCGTVGSASSQPTTPRSQDVSRVEASQRINGNLGPIQEGWNAAFPAICLFSTPDEWE